MYLKTSILLIGSYTKTLQNPKTPFRNSRLINYGIDEGSGSNLARAGFQRCIKDIAAQNYMRYCRGYF